MSEDKVLVQYEAKDGVAYLTLDDPPVNGYTHEMMRQIDEGILKARFDTDVHVIVLTGHGREVLLCRRQHQDAPGRRIRRFKYYFCLHANETLNRLEHTPKLVIAALNGHTVGGGLEIAMAADHADRTPPGRQGFRQDRPARRSTSACSPAPAARSASRRMVGKSRVDRAHGHRSSDQSFEDGLGPWAASTTIWDRRRLRQLDQQVPRRTRKQFCPPNMASKAVGRIKRSVQSGSAECPVRVAVSPSSASFSSSCSSRPTPPRA